MKFLNRVWDIRYSVSNINLVAIRYSNLDINLVDIRYTNVKIIQIKIRKSNPKNEIFEPNYILNIKYESDGYSIFKCDYHPFYIQ